MTTPEDAWRKKIERWWKGEIHWKVPLAQYTTLRVGGPALAMIFPESVEALAGLIVNLRRAEIPWKVIGRGSNILFSDRGFPGVILVMGAGFADISMISSKDDRVVVRVQSGCGLARLVSWCVEQGFSGLEFAAGIPGSVGGAVRMNAGAWGSEMATVVRKVKWLNRAGKPCESGREQLRFGYRALDLGEEAVLLETDFELEPGESRKIEETCRRLHKERKAKQPQKAASAGSFFKNPPHGAAGKLIEEAGLKGLQIGGAMVSDIHANFLINTGNATARDFYELMNVIRNRVMAEKGIRLETEVHIIGNFEDN